MQLLDKIDFNSLVDLINQSKERLVISLPGVDCELATALVDLKKASIALIIINNEEEVIRNGYGDQDGVNLLVENGFKLKECNGNMVSFIISDELGYFFFPQSRIFTNAPKGYNAFKFDPMTLRLLLGYFTDVEFSENVNKDFENTFQHFADSTAMFEREGTGKIASEFDGTKFETIKKKIAINPPIKPDLQRQINTYTAKIQFVELKYSGGKLNNKVVILPEKAIPINSPELKQLLKTRIKMFQGFENLPEYKHYTALYTEIERIRDEYLIPITCRPQKSILKLEKKQEFKNEIDKLNKAIIKFNQKLPDILERSKLNTIELLSKELKEFFKVNEPTGFESYSQDTKERSIALLVNNITSKIHFPEVHTLINKISISVLYYDLTWNDFKDDKLLEEFTKKEVISANELSSIVDLKKAFEVAQ